MGNVLRVLFKQCCQPTTTESDSLGPHGVSAHTVGLTALARDLLHFEVTSQVTFGSSQNSTTINQKGTFTITWVLITCESDEIKRPFLDSNFLFFLFFFFFFSRCLKGSISMLSPPGRGKSTGRKSSPYPYTHQLLRLIVQGESNPSLSFGPVIQPLTCPQKGLELIIVG